MLAERLRGKVLSSADDVLQISKKEFREANRAALKEAYEGANAKWVGGGAGWGWGGSAHIQAWPARARACTCPSAAHGVGIAQPRPLRCGLKERAQPAATARALQRGADVRTPAHPPANTACTHWHAPTRARTLCAQAQARHLPAGAGVGAPVAHAVLPGRRHTQQHGAPCVVDKGGARWDWRGCGKMRQALHLALTGSFGLNVPCFNHDGGQGKKSKKQQQCSVCVSQSQ